MKVQRKILVVDDEKEVTLTLEGFFLAKNYKMFTALTGEDALKIVKEQHPDLVLLDMRMPGIHGIDVLKNIKQNYPSTKVIVITAYDDEYKRRAEGIGIDGFLAKPFGLKELTTKMEEILHQESQEETEAAPLRKIEVDEIIPKIKLLFVEPDISTYVTLCLYLSGKEALKDKLLIEIAHSQEEAFAKLESFQPSIVLIDIAKLGSSDKLANEIMNSPNRPKDIIIYSEILSPNDKERLKGLRVKSWETENLRSLDVLDNLANIIKDIAKKHNLIIQ